MTRRAAILNASLTLQHVPDLVRYGSKPSREQARIPDVLKALRSYDDAVGYAPNQVFIGNLPVEELNTLERPWWGRHTEGKPVGPTGEILEQSAFYRLMAELDQFDLVKLGESPGAGELPLFEGAEVVGAFAGAHEADESLSAQVLLENLACKAGAVHATRFMLAQSGVDPDSVSYVMGSGEEAIGDRYQRGGGSLGKSVAEAAGLGQASGSDIKAFCAGPLHALILAGALVESGVYDRVAVVAGGALGKLGMKFEGLLSHGSPILEDVLAGMAILVGVAEEPGQSDAADGRGRSASGRGRLVATSAARGHRRRTARSHGPVGDRHRGLRDRAAQPGDHRAGGRRRRTEPQLPDARRPRDRARRARRAKTPRSSSRPTDCPASRRPRDTSRRRCRGSRTPFRGRRGELKRRC